jgi:hypothetical protein
MFPEIEFHVISEFKTVAGGGQANSLAARNR